MEGDQITAAVEQALERRRKLASDLGGQGFGLRLLGEAIIGCKGAGAGELPASNYDRHAAVSVLWRSRTCGSAVRKSKWEEQKRNEQ
jgi:hypothetical protein